MYSLFDQGICDPCPASFNMTAYVLAQAGVYTDKEALLIVTKNGVETYTYQALERSVLGIATGFQSMGLRPGQRVLLRLGNTVDFPLAFLAALAVDLVPIPTSSLLTSIECDKIVAEIKPSIIIAADGIACPTDRAIPRIDVSALRAMRRNPVAKYVYGDPNRLGYIIYTSGTSGVPRAVCHAHRAIWARRMMWRGWYGLSTEDRLLHAGAFNWTYTLGTGLMDPWTVGATAIIPGLDHTPAELPQLMSDHKVSLFAAAPGVYRQILKHKNLQKVPTLRHGLSAGEKLPDRTRASWKETMGTEIYEAFGMSECSTFLSGSPEKNPPPGTSGFPQAGRRVAIVNSNGDPVPYNQTGILAISRADPGLMLGYYNAEKATEDKFVGEWFLTGDMASMDQNGAVQYKGRNDDMMNAGGFRVSPLEVEHVINTFPGIQESAAVEVEVKSDTTVIAAFFTSDTSISETSLHSFVIERLAGYKSPRMYKHVPELPKGANGKILRQKIRELYEASHGKT
ncbi:MAG: class I adenylate-forming enzyme family protein [Pseudoruegeria sp.]